MKLVIRSLLLFIIISGSVSPVSGENERVSERDIERIHITIDRDFYIAGEEIRFSLFSINKSYRDFHYSRLSKVGYIELHNNNGMVASAKCYIVDGRGGGSIELAPNLPTGNYKIVAYTKQMLNENDPQFFEREVAIIAPLSGEKIENNVIFTDEPLDLRRDDLQSRMLSVNLSNKEIEKESELKISLKNLSNESQSLAISVHKVSRISPDTDYISIDKSLSKYNITTLPEFSNRYIPEYEGEIIRAKISTDDLPTYNSVISMAAVGDGMNLYFSPVGKDGELVFYTNSLTDKRELVIEPYNFLMEEYKIDFIDPFINLPIENTPPLHISRDSYNILNERAFEMQVARRYGLYRENSDQLEVANPFLSYKSSEYILDDYRRFLNLEETIIEYVRELRIRKVAGKQQLISFWNSSFGAHLNQTISNKPALVFFDGIPVYDHDSLLSHDAYKIRSIEIYTHAIYLGEYVFEGIVFINTINGKYEELKMNKSTKIIDYNAPQIAKKFTASSLINNDKIPDIRTLLYWNPILNIDDSAEIDIYTSSIPGYYCIKIEGISESGTPILSEIYFEVKK